MPADLAFLGNIHPFSAAGRVDDLFAWATEFSSHQRNVAGHAVLVRAALLNVRYWTASGLDS
jgi:hypothetical protein